MKPRHIVILLIVMTAAGSALLHRVRAVRGWMHSHEDVYRRSQDVFDRSLFYKPRERTTDDPLHRLAPLLVQSIDGLEPDAVPRFGALFRRADGGHAVDVSRPTVYAILDDTAPAGAMRRLIFVWVYACEAPDTFSTPWCGLRMFFDETGQPYLWETRSAHSPRCVFYVSRRVEETAATAFGAPLPGRRHVVEPALLETPASRPARPGVIVARIIEDGPEAMGPFVYLGAGCAEARTLICRCMPSQARDFAATATYDLRAFGSAEEFAENLSQQAAWTKELMRWIQSPIEDAGLRLPEP